MRHKVLIVILAVCAFPLFAANENEQLQQEINRLEQRTKALQTQLNQLHRQLNAQVQNRSWSKKSNQEKHRDKTAVKPSGRTYHSSLVSVHSLDAEPNSVEFNPTALIADGHVVTFIGGVPIVSSPYLGSMPAFDGSDYIVNIPSINRDIRLMQQRRRLYQAYKKLGYPEPNLPIIAFSGKVEPIGSVNSSYFNRTTTDLNLGSSELDMAVALNDMVEGYMALAYDAAPPQLGGQRVANSALFLNMGFVNIGNLEKTPFYFTGGQFYVPFGRYSSAMVSATLPMQMARTRARPFIFGYKSQGANGPLASVFAYRSDTTLGNAGVGGINVGYDFNGDNKRGEIGASLISSIDDATGLQYTGSQPNTTFGGFASITSGNEAVKKVPAFDFHGSINVDRYYFTAEWVSASRPFRPQDLSFNGQGALPQAGQLEAGVTFMLFDRPSTLAAAYQWTKEALALNLPAQRISGVFNISIWKNTVESLEYRHDIDYKNTQYANGAAPSGVVNANTVGTGHSADTVLAQIGVYF